MARLDVTICIARDFCNHLCEVKPGTNALIRVVIYSRITIKLAVLNNVKDGCCQIVCVSRCSNLIKDYLQLWFCGSEIKHGLDEVLTELTIEPCSTEDEIINTGILDVLLAM